MCNWVLLVILCSLSHSPCQSHKIIYRGCSISKVLQIMQIKWEVIVILNVAHLFHWKVIIFQHNPWAHWCIFPILALVWKCHLSRKWVLGFSTIHRNLQWNDCWKYLCLMCAVCDGIVMLNDHTSQHITCWGYWSNTWEAAFSTWMRKWEWLFVHKGLQVQEVHLYCDRILKLVPR
jgi:hypothetical protein